MAVAASLHLHKARKKSLTLFFGSRNIPYYPYFHHRTFLICKFDKEYLVNTDSSTFHFSYLKLISE